jgi:hypothetical protein
VTEFLNNRGPGYEELMRLLSRIFEDQKESADA